MWAGSKKVRRLPTPSRALGILSSHARRAHLAQVGHGAPGPPAPAHAAARAPRARRRTPPPRPPPTEFCAALHVHTIVCTALCVHPPPACCNACARAAPAPVLAFCPPRAARRAPTARTGSSAGRGAAPHAHHGVYQNPDMSCSTASARARPSSARRRRPPSPPPSRRAARRATPAHRHRPAAPPLTAAAALLITPTARRRAAQHCISCGS